MEQLHHLRFRGFTLPRRGTHTSTVTVTVAVGVVTFAVIADHAVAVTATVSSCACNLSLNILFLPPSCALSHKNNFPLPPSIPSSFPPLGTHQLWSVCRLQASLRKHRCSATAVTPARFFYRRHHELLHQVPPVLPPPPTPTISPSILSIFCPPSPISPPMYLSYPLTPPGN